MKVWICYVIAGGMALLGAIVLPESVREARRISRLSHEGRRLAAEITRIDEVSESTNLGSVDRAQYGDTKIVDHPPCVTRSVAPSIRLATDCLTRVVVADWEIVSRL